MSSSFSNFQGDYNVSGSANQDGFGKLPAVDVGNNVFMVIDVLYFNALLGIARLIIE